MKLRESSHETARGMDHSLIRTLRVNGDFYEPGGSVAKCEIEHACNELVKRIELCAAVEAALTLKAGASSALAVSLLDLERAPDSSLV